MFDRSRESAVTAGSAVRAHDSEMVHGIQLHAHFLIGSVGPQVDQTEARNTKRGTAFGPKADARR
jgi:hypothetical protein